jgi:tetratricopeptide (TPR) repeat protein
VIAGGWDGTLRLWDAGSGREIAELTGRGASVLSVAVSPDGRMALVGDAAGLARLVQLPLTFEQALADLTAATKLRPRAVSAYLLRATCYLQKKRFKEALADLNKALALDGKCKEAYFTRALLHAEKEDLDRALADFSAVIRLDPRDAEALYNRSLIYSEKGDFARARKDLDKAISLKPELGKRKPR